MILKRNFNPIKVLSYVWQELLITLIVAICVYVAFFYYDIKQLVVPFAPLGVLGSAIAFFLGFRNSSSFGRWSQASNFWIQIHNQSRIFARLIVTFVQSHAHTPSYKSDVAQTFVRSMINRQLAFVHALRLHLRNQQSDKELQPFLSADELKILAQKQHKPSYLLKMQASEIYKAMANGTLQGFDSFQLEGCLLQLNTQMANTEGIKNIPIPRQYDFFTRIFVRIFVYLAPLSVIEFFAKSNVAFMFIPFALLLTFVFVITEKIGTVNEDPFENRITDVPLTAMCRDIERDLYEILDEQQLPSKIQPSEGYLF